MLLYLVGWKLLLLMAATHWAPTAGRVRGNLRGGGGGRKGEAGGGGGRKEAGGRRGEARLRWTGGLQDLIIIIIYFI